MGISAVFLAAGCGTRLRPLTADRPKCMVPVNSKTILERAIDTLADAGVNRMVLVVGYRAGQIFDITSGLRDELTKTFVRNPVYEETGSLYSLELALHHIPATDDLIVLEGDVVFHPDILGGVIAAMDGTGVATAIAPKTPALEGSLAHLDGDGFLSCCKHLSMRDAGFPEDGAFKTINITGFSAGATVTCFHRVTRSVLDEFGPQAPIERAFDQYVTAGHPVRGAVFGDHPWMEVDDVNDLARAERLFEHELARCAE